MYMYIRTVYNGCVNNATAVIYFYAVIYHVFPCNNVNYYKITVEPLNRKKMKVVHFINPHCFGGGPNSNNIVSFIVQSHITANIVMQRNTCFDVCSTLPLRITLPEPEN